MRRVSALTVRLLVPFSVEVTFAMIGTKPTHGARRGHVSRGSTVITRAMKACSSFM